jgi:hypothetical protein
MGTSLCADAGFPPLSAPALHVTGGETLTLVPDAATTVAGSSLLPESSTTPLTTFGAAAQFALPATLPATSYLDVATNWSSGSSHGDQAYFVKLVVDPPAPVPEAATTGPVTAVPAVAGSVRRGAARVRWTVTCPKSAAAASCAGTSQVRTHGRLVARKAFRGLAAGQGRTLTALIRPAAKRYLRKHPHARLKATVSRAGA